MVTPLTEAVRLKPIDIPYYSDFLSNELRAELLKDSSPVDGLPNLRQVGTGGGLETKESLKYLSDLYQLTKKDLAYILKRRIADRKFIDERTKAISVYNKEFKKDFLSPEYKTVMGLEDGDGRIVIGPKIEKYYEAHGKHIAPIPEFLQGNHVTLFGPPDSAKLCINAMNAFHRQLKDEPQVVKDLLANCTTLPKWGADDEDSKTPMREDLVDAGKNLTACLKGELKFEKYELAKDRLSHPIKRFPGLALPCFFLFDNESPIPLHLYDFALHFFANWNNPKALAFYVPKLENEEEARYIRVMLETAEVMIKRRHPEYQIGTIRLMIVLENPRAVFRTNEIMDELFPYFVGASLGWHDYLASTARLFKEDANYRIPVKADPEIVIKYIKASHDLVANVIGKRGGVKVGGMYGILSINSDLKSPSFQITIKGFIKDIVTQLKRDLTGFWVAHPDFVRLGLAIVEAWKLHKEGNSKKIERIITAFLDEKYHKDMIAFVHGPDVKDTMEKSDPMYGRLLIVANSKESTYIANNHPDEIRYNVFQSLQYLTDWLSGNGCVALPAMVEGTAVRVMDDLATAERSRWEVWHEIRHGRFSIDDFLRIAHEEYQFIRKDKSNDKKIVQVKWDERTEKWYPVAMKLMIKLMTDHEPVEFATQLLLPFTIDSIRKSDDPWEAITTLDPKKFAIDPYTTRFNYYFEMCGSLWFARTMAKNLVVNLDQVKSLIMNFAKQDILEAAYFHGDIGESKKTLDKMASSEQAKVLQEDDKLKGELIELGAAYIRTFGMKFLISAHGRSGSEILTELRARSKNNHNQEMDHAREALWLITEKRLKAHPLNLIGSGLKEIFEKHKIHDAQITVLTASSADHLIFGKSTHTTWFEMASLSKTVGSAFAIEYFIKKGISIHAPVDSLLAKTKSTFRLNDEKVTLAHLMSHSALNLHYVNGLPANKKMLAISEFLTGNTEYKYDPIKVIHQPGTTFSYSGAGFIVLEHLIEALEEKSIFDLTRPFLDSLDMKDFSFEQGNLPGVEYAIGSTDQGDAIEGTRKMFPAFAAGSMGTADAMSTFLTHLEKAYRDINGSGGLSHDTARLMLHGTDKGCMNFMGVKMGLGVFIGEAGQNRFAIHQGANDGFRCIFLHCYAGPDRGKGLVSLCNGDLKGVLFNAEVTQFLLRELNISGIDFSKFNSDFKIDSLKQEEIVNIGYKSLVFSAFERPVPEPITDRGPADPMAIYNLAVGGKILSVTNDLFARAENLCSDHLPKFDPELFGKQGKVMDSWETVRHNQAGQDELVFELIKPSSIQYILLSTKYHTGNHSPVVKLEGLAGKEWIEILPKTNITGHSEIRHKLSKDTPVITQIRATMYPDGGLTRLGLFHDLPEELKKTFDGLCRVYEEKVPVTKKPMSIPYHATPFDISQNMKAFKKGDEVNFASSALGAKILKATDEHYSPAVLVISPFGPINMFDGMESARSRTPGHYEEVVVELARPTAVHKLEMDFTYFVNNNPWEVEVEGLSKGKWLPLVTKVNVKAFAGNKKLFSLKGTDLVEQIRVKTFPDGGMNRLKVYGREA